MLTEEDFKNAEEAINIIDCWPHGLKAGGRRKKPFTTLAKKVLTEARRIF